MLTHIVPDNINIASPTEQMALKLQAMLTLSHKEGTGINIDGLFVFSSKLTIRISVSCSLGSIEREKGEMPEKYYESDGRVCC